MKKLLYSIIFSFISVLFLNCFALGGEIGLETVTRQCRYAQQELSQYVDQVHEKLQKQESGDVIGYKWSQQGTDKLKLNFYVGYNYGPDGCLGVSEDKQEASKYLQTVQQIVEGELAKEYRVLVLGCGLGKPNPGDAKYFTNCQGGGFIPHDYWLIKCMVQKYCGETRPQRRDASSSKKDNR